LGKECKANCKIIQFVVKKSVAIFIHSRHGTNSHKQANTDGFTANMLLNFVADIV